MRRDLEDHYAKTADEERRAKEEKERNIEKKKALHLHYLVSTAAIPSVFQPPSFCQDSTALPAVENYIRSVNRAKLVIPSLSTPKN